MIQAGATLQQRYKIDRQIGQGGMGAVYVGMDVRFGSTVAIKETLCMDANFRKAIEREARLLNSLKHNALPRVSDHFEEEASQFLVMEYIPGDDVAAILERDQRAFPVERVLKWADDLLDALDYLHTQDIPVIHRDIKPQNLKITPRGQIILLDFGLAKGNPTDAGHNTAAKSIFGYSRNYASLEQIQGTGTDPRSDLYSLAATLYHLITNTAPEDALTRAMSVLSQRADPLQPANTLNVDVPRGVAGVLHKALDLNAAERPASAAEMREMLRDHASYGHLADPVAVAASARQEMVFAQQTRLMTEGTHADAQRPTEVKTELLPSYDSQVTSVAAAATASAQPTSVAAAQFTSVAAPKRRGFTAAAAALALLLVGAGIAGGLYVVNPSVFGIENRSPDAGASLNVANAKPTSAEVNTGTANASATSDSSLTPPSTAGPTVRSVTTDRSTQASKEDQPADRSRTDQAAVDTKPGAANPTPGQSVTVGRGETFTPAIPNQPVRPTFGDEAPFTKDFPFKNMTPEQRRQLQRALRMQNPPANAVRPAPRRTP